jgi:hypothetical protein
VVPEAGLAPSSSPPSSPLSACTGFLQTPRLAACRSRPWPPGSLFLLAARAHRSVRIVVDRGPRTRGERG